MAVTARMLPCKGHNSPILNCTGTRKYDIDKKSEFYTSNSPFAYFPAELQKRGQDPVGLIPYCKDCVQKIFEYYYDGGKNQFDTAVYYTCQKLDIPFILEIFNGIVNDVKEKETSIEFGGLSKKYMGLYINRLNIGKIKYKDKTDFTCSDNDLSDIDMKIARRELEKEEAEEYLRSWGYQDSVEDYRFLQDLFVEYTKGVEFSNAIQRDLYRDLCLARLKKHKMDSSNSTATQEEITKVYAQISKLTKDLKADDFEANKPKTISEKTMFEKIRLVEENNVKEIYKDPKKFEDINKVRKYVETFSLRPLGNMLLGKKDFNVNLDDLEEYNLDEK